MTAPYLTDLVSLDTDLTGKDFVVALAIDGIGPQQNFNKWVDKAYKKCPLIAVVKPDPYYYQRDFTLGKWPDLAHDEPLKWMRSHFLAPDGKTKYAISAVLIDLRNYFYPNGKLIEGNWITGTARHWRDWLTDAGFKTFLFIGPQIEMLHPDGALNPAIYIQTESNPVAVYEQDRGAVCKWPRSKFLKRTSVTAWESIIPLDKFYSLIGWVGAVPAEPPVPTPVPVPIPAPAGLTDAQKLAAIAKILAS
jgi:hypothetical protein